MAKKFDLPPSPTRRDGELSGSTDNAIPSKGQSGPFGPWRERNANGAQPSGKGVLELLARATKIGRAHV